MLWSGLAWPKMEPRDGEEDKKPGESTDAPLLDLSDAAVKKMIKAAKKRGYVTIEELNEVMPAATFTSDQIEDIYSMLNEMGINVVESDDSEEGEKALMMMTMPIPAATSSKRRNPRRLSKPRRTPNRSTARMTPCACICARWARWRVALARGRNCHRQAHRGRPRGDDCRAVRKTAHLPGHHHLAR